MIRSELWVAPLAALLVFVSAFPAAAEITSIAGSAYAEINEIYDGQARDQDRVTEDFPGTSATLPLQVFAELYSLETEEEAAAAAGAQFADPRTLLQANPEEFAINLALNSLSTYITYESDAYTSETREVVFTQTEFPTTQDGDQVQVIGRFFLDGALTIFAADSAHDLTGAYVRLLVKVTRSGGELPTATVFSGEVRLDGATNGGATNTAVGDFPTTGVIRSDLSVFVPDFAAFQALVIPNISIDYTYDAIIGEPLTLEASVQVLAANAADASGVAAVIGTPAIALQQVIALTETDQLATKMMNALADERANPTGVAAFPQQSLFPILPLCGSVGFEALLGMGLLAGFKLAGGRRFV